MSDRILEGYGSRIVAKGSGLIHWAGLKSVMRVLKVQDPRLVEQLDVFFDAARALPLEQKLGTLARIGADSWLRGHNGPIPCPEGPIREYMKLRRDATMFETRTEKEELHRQLEARGWYFRNWYGQVVYQFTDLISIVEDLYAYSADDVERATGCMRIGDRLAGTYREWTERGDILWWPSEARFGGTILDGWHKRAAALTGPPA